MLEENKVLFDEFKQIHDKYMENPLEYKAEFNEKGARVVEVIRVYERNLCAQSNSGQYGKFSPNLAEKFWEAVRGYFPRIDFVGVK